MSKKVTDKPTRSEKSEDDGSTLVEPSLVSVIGVISADKKAMKSPEWLAARRNLRKKAFHTCEKVVYG